MTIIREFAKGIWKENPVLRLLLGMCPALAVTTSAVNGFGMGICTLAVLLGSNLVVSTLRSLIPPKVRIPAFIMIIATFVTVVDLVMNAFAHDLHKALGLFIPLIVVNCVILGRAEAFASRRGVLLSLFDGLGMGIGFTLALVVVGGIREILGNGTLFVGLGDLLGIPFNGFTNLFTASYEPVIVMVLAPGAFITLGFVLAAMNKMDSLVARRRA